MKKLHPLLEWLSFFIPTSAVIKITGQQLFLPVYHTVQGHYSLPHIHHLYPPKSIAQFEKDLDFLLKYYQPISLDEVYQITTGKKTLQKNSFHLTFDDGLREVYEFAFPILQKKGIPATVFLNSDFVDNRDLFYRYKASLLIEENLKENANSKNKNQINFLDISFDKRNKLDEAAEYLNLDFNQFLKKQQPYLTTPQIQELQNNDFTFGAHSINHPKYSEISFDEKVRQTEKSVQFVTQHFKEKYKTFAFPFHDFNIEDSYFEKMKNDEIIDLSFGSAIFPTKKIPNHLQRFPMEGNNLDTNALFNFKSLFYFAKNIRKIKK